MSIGTPYESTRMRAVITESLRQQACLRCGHRWLPRKVTRPVRCPACKSSYWSRPRRQARPKQGTSSPDPQGTTGIPADQAGRHSFRAALDAMKAMKQEGMSWGEIAEAIASRFGVVLEKDQLKVLIR